MTVNSGYEGGTVWRRLLHNICCYCECDDSDYERISHISADRVGVYRYTDNSRIGGGAFGDVYLAKNENDPSEEVAIKVILVSEHSRAIVSLISSN